MPNPTIKPDHLPVPAATPIMSRSPVVLDVPGRAAPLELRVSAPIRGDNLPLLLLSHGFGGSNFLASMRGYGPLVDYYAAHGFVVLQPTHLSSKTLGLDPDGPEGALFWRSRAEDMHTILDRLDEIEKAVPELSGRMDRDRVAALGHSAGGHTVAMLSGMTVTDPKIGHTVDLSEPRVKVAVMLAPPGKGEDLGAWASEHYPALKYNDFGGMTKPGLVVAGDKDFTPLFSDREDWRRDAYYASPGPKCLLTVFDGEHMLGGISGYDAAETSDEDPDRVAAVQRYTWAYMRSSLLPEDRAWDIVKRELDTSSEPFGRMDCK